jgi:hypothetical protein
VQLVLSGKTNARATKHRFLFRRLLECAACGYSLVGERQKGRVYYRCHTRACSTSGIREDSVSDAVLVALAPLRFDEREKRYLAARLNRLRMDWTSEQESRRQALRLRSDALQNRLARLMDAFLDKTIDKDLFEERKKALLMERQEVREQLGRVSQPSVPERVAEFLELAGSASVSYEMGLDEEKRELLAIVTSNRQLQGKTPVITLAQPFREVADRRHDSNGGPHRARLRTLDGVIDRIGQWLSLNPDPVFERRTQDNKLTGSDKSAEVAA